ISSSGTAARPLLTKRPSRAIGLGRCSTERFFTRFCMLSMYRTKYENRVRKAPLDEPRRRRRQERPMKLRFQPIFAAVVGAVALTASCPAFAHDMGGMEMNSADGADTGATGGMGKHMVMSDHMTMTPSRAATPQDLERAQMILSTMRGE